MPESKLLVQKSDEDHRMTSIENHDDASTLSLNRSNVRDLANTGANSIINPRKTQVPWKMRGVLI